MDQDPPWCVSEWSPERDEDVNELESSSPSKCCRPQMKEEADDYSEEFFLWNIDLEQKYHPKESLSNQPQVNEGIVRDEFE